VRRGGARAGGCGSPPLARTRRNRNTRERDYDIVGLGLAESSTARARARTTSQATTKPTLSTHQRAASSRRTGPSGARCTSDLWAACSLGAAGNLYGKVCENIPAQPARDGYGGSGLSSSGIGAHHQVRDTVAR